MAKTVLEWTLKANDQASREFESVGRSADRMSGLVKAGAFAAGAALATAAIAAVRFASDSVQAYAEAEQAQNRLNFAFEKFPALVGGNIDAIRKMNTELQKKTRFEDDSIAASEGVLAQYGLNADQLQELVPLMLDYAAVTGKDVTTAAEDMGKAILGQGRALKAIGVDFNDAGDPVTNYNQLIASLRAQVQGFSETDAQTLSGGLERIKNQFGDIQENLGAAFAPALESASGYLENSLIPRLDETISVITPNLTEALADPDFKAFADGMVEMIGRVVEAIPDWINGLGDVYTALYNFGYALGEFNTSGPIATFFNDFKAGVTDIQNQNYGQKFLESLGTAGGAQSTGAGLATNFGMGMESAIPEVQNSASQVGGAARDGLRSVSGDFSSIGGDVARGFARGIRDSQSEAVNAAGEMAAEAVTRAKRVLDSHSPSRVFESVGASVPQGFAQGVDAEAWKASAAVGRMLNLAPSGGRAPSVGLGGMGSQVTINVPVTVTGSVLSDENRIANAVGGAIINATRQGAFNRVEFSRAIMGT